MKCPKCSYISYDMPERCRNCGYDFPRAEPSAEVDLPLRDAGDTDPAPDFPLTNGKGPELPLFGDGPDAPLVNPSATPRTPLAVRRSATDPSRQRPAPRRERRTGPLRAPAPPVIVTPAPPTRGESAPLLAMPTQPVVVRSSAHTTDGDPYEGAGAADTDTPDVAVESPPPMAVGDAAPALRRLAAAVVDLLIIVAIDLAVVRLTLGVLGQPWGRALSLRWLPLSLFFLLLNGGYIVSFTVASGQTIGKMLAGVRVVGGSSLGVPVAQAVVRAAVLALAVAPLGLGYLPALLTRDGRGIHDRLANTRVIRA